MAGVPSLPWSVADIYWLFSPKSLQDIPRDQARNSVGRLQSFVPFDRCEYLL